MVALGTLKVRHGSTITLFNRRSPKVSALTQADVERLRDELGRLVGNQWQAVVRGVAIVATVEVAKHG